MAMTHRLLFATLLLAATTTSSCAPGSSNALEVSVDTWTDGDWPLTVDSGTLSCVAPSAVFFTDAGGTMWPVNGMARTHSGRWDARPDLRPIWRTDEEAMAELRSALVSAFPDSVDSIDADLRANPQMINVGAMIDLGLSLCE